MSCPNEVFVLILNYCLQHPGFITYYLSKSLQPNYGGDHKLELQVLEVCRRLREVGSQVFYEMNDFKIDFSEYEPQLHSPQNFVVRVGSNKTNWIRQLECTTPFSPLDSRLKQLLWLYSQCFSSLRDIRINLVLLPDDQENEITSPNGISMPVADNPSATERAMLAAVATLFAVMTISQRVSLVA
jgi:hypothetical protein